MYGYSLRGRRRTGGGIPTFRLRGHYFRDIVVGVRKLAYASLPQIALESRMKQSSALEANSYQMIKSISIKRFRGFSTSNLNDCRRINIVVGENGAGKTSFLESIFLASSSNVEVALRVRNWRGLGEGNVQGTPAQIDDALWLDLFHDFDKTSSVVISLDGEGKDDKRSLAINHSELETVLNINLKNDAPHTGKAPVSFRWRGPGDFDSGAVRPVVENGQIKLPNTKQPPHETYFFPSSHLYSATETATRFSTLSRSSKEGEVIELFSRHFPTIEGLSIEVAAGVAMVYAKIKDKKEKQPLNLISGGMSKLASILFAIPTQVGGVVLIDEIENGLYYKKLPVVWESLLSFCKKYNTQVFASTHSLECLTSAAELAKENPEDFSVIYVSNKADGNQLRQFSGEKFVLAIESDIEIR